MLTAITYPNAQKDQKKEKKDKDEGREQYGQAPPFPRTATNNTAKLEETVKDHEKEQAEREETAGCA